jgi:hypothetical protein
MVSAALAASTAKTYATEAQCERDRALRPAACKTAFANARTEFELKAPSYRSRRACFQHFGPCMPWPIGARAFSEFRPQWLGVTVDTSAPEAAAVPAVASGKLKLIFTPQSLVSLLPAAASQTEPLAHETPQAKPGRAMSDSDGEGEGPASPPPPRGSGFEVIDGVLTYPAPARFQPKALLRRH